MIRVLLLTFLLVSAFQSFSQRRQLTKLISEFREGNFSESHQKFLQIEKEEGATPEVLFTRYIYHISIKRSLKDLDSAYAVLKASFAALEKIEPKDKEKICKDFELCEALREKYYQDMELLLFNSYTSGLSKPTIIEYKKKYPEGRWVASAEHIIDSLDYASVKTSNDLALLKSYIKDHPGSTFNNEVQQLIYNTAFASAKNSDNIEQIKKFIQEYTTAPQINEAQTLLEEWEWKKADLEGSVKSYSAFISGYSKSKYVSEATKKIEQIEWSEAEKQNSPSAYRSFITRYPNSSFVKEATRRYEELRVNVFPYLTADKKYMLFDIDKNTFRTQDVYENLVLVGKSKFIASKFKKFGLIDKSGEVIIPLTYNCINVVDGFVQLKLGNKSAVYTANGEKVIDFLYDQIDIEKHYFKAIKYGASDTSRKQIDVFDKRGTLIFSGQYHFLYVINDTLFNGSVNNSEVLISSRSKNILAKYQSIGVPENNVMIVSNTQKYGLINTGGKVILPAQYDYITGFDSSHYFTVKNKLGQSALVNSVGEFLVNFQPKEITGLGEGLFFFQTTNNDGQSDDGVLFDAKKRTYLANEKYAWVYQFTNGFALAGKQGKSGYIDLNGKWIVPPLYDDELRYYGEGDHHEMPDSDVLEDTEEEIVSCYPTVRSIDSELYYNYYPSNNLPGFYDDMAIVQIEGLYGYVNKAGDLKIPIIFEYAENFQQGIANVRMTEQEKSISKIIDRSGKIILNNAYVMYFVDKNRKALVNLEDDYAIMDLETYEVRKLNLRKGYEYLTPMPDYYLTSFKGKEVVVLSSGLELMDPDADFSDYDFKQEVLKVNNLFYSGKTDEAISGYLDLLNKKPHSYTLFVMLSRCYEEQKDDYNFKRYLDLAIEIKPNDRDLLSKRVEYNYQKSNWRDVISDLNSLLSSDTSFYADYYFKRAYAHASIGNEENALNDYGWIITNSKSYPMAFNNRGVIYMNRRLYAQALSDFNNAIVNGDKSDTQNQGLYYANKGNALFNLNKKPEACASWNKALTLGRTSISSMISRYCTGAK